MAASGLEGPDASADTNIEQWKIKRLIKNLETSRGNGTSMISLIIKPKDEISRINRMLTEEYGTASNIKSRVNRLSVLSAISSTQQRKRAILTATRKDGMCKEVCAIVSPAWEGEHSQKIFASGLKRYNRTPPNGLVIYCGTIITDDGKEKKVNMDFEPFKPVNTSLYLCDNKFHVEALKELLESNDKFGFIIMDGAGSLFGTLQGNTREILHRFTIDLPKKHGRGGQSALRFARLRMEKRHNYVRRVAETSVQMYITNDKVNVSGIVLAGSADFKTDLAQSDMFDQRLVAKVIKIVDISYGGENGFNQAIELAQDTYDLIGFDCIPSIVTDNDVIISNVRLANVKFIQEKKIILKFFEEVAVDSGRYCFGVDETLKALEMGAVETLIVWEALPIQRLIIKNPQTEEETVVFQQTERESDMTHLKHKETGIDLECIEKIPLVEWIVQNYTSFGAALEFVTNCSQEGSQFQRGFGGFGGLLRYKVDFQEFEEDVRGGNSDDDDFM